MAEVGRVHIGTPAYGGQVTTRYMFSILKAIPVLQAAGIEVIVSCTEGESLVQRARNGITAKFLADNAATHLIFIDADIEFEPGDIIRLLGHDVGIVCGLYPKKVYPIDFAFHPAGVECERNEDTGAVEIAHGATGFMCIKRETFEKLAAERAVTKIERCLGTPAEHMPFYFDWFPVEVVDGVMLSEDYAFCRRWRSIGGRVWCDPLIKLVHHGKHAYSGDPAELFTVKEAA